MNNNKPKVYIRITSIEDNVLKFKFMPFSGTFAENLRFAKQHERKVWVKPCKQCEQGFFKTESYHEQCYDTNYRRLTYDLLYPNIFNLQFALYDKLKIWPLHYDIVGNNFLHLNYTLDWTSEDGWFNVVVDLSKKDYA